VEKNFIPAVTSANYFLQREKISFTKEKAGSYTLPTVKIFMID